MTRILLLLVICAVSAGCASHGQLSTLPKLDASTNACDLHIIRKSSMLGGGISYTVITAKYPRQMFLGTAETSLEINCKLNEPIYVYMKPGISVGLSVLSDEEGAKLVRESKSIDLK